MKNAKKVPVGKLVVFIVLVAITVCASVFSTQIWGDESVFQQTVTNNQFVQALFGWIPALIRSVQIVTIAFLISEVLRWLSTKFLAKTNKGKTISKLLNSFIKWVINITTVLLVLGAWGVNATALFAGAGILTLIIGLGVQSLVADIVAGIFIVFEGSFEVDDIVVIDDWRGTVREIGIRTTKIEDAEGNIKIINNSEIKAVVNRTRELSVAKCTVGIEYGESIVRVEKVIADNLEGIGNKIDSIVEGPFYKGVASLSDSSVDLLFTAKCKEEDVAQIQRELNREIKLLFDENNINVPFPQLVVTQAAAEEGK